LNTALIDTKFNNSTEFRALLPGNQPQIKPFPHKLIERRISQSPFRSEFEVKIINHT